MAEDPYRKRQKMVGTDTFRIDLSALTILLARKNYCRHY